MFSCMEESPGFTGLDKNACDKQSGWGSPAQMLVPKEVTEDRGSFPGPTITFPPPRGTVFMLQTR